MILSCTMKMLTYLTKAKACLKMSPFENRDTEREATHQTGKQATMWNPHVPRIPATPCFCILILNRGSYNFHMNQSRSSPFWAVTYFKIHLRAVWVPEWQDHLAYQKQLCSRLMQETRLETGFTLNPPKTLRCLGPPTNNTGFALDNKNNAFKSLVVASKLNKLIFSWGFHIGQ